MFLQDEHYRLFHQKPFFFFLNHAALNKFHRNPSIQSHAHSCIHSVKFVQVKRSWVSRGKESIVSFLKQFSLRLKSLNSKQLKAIC